MNKQEARAVAVSLLRSRLAMPSWSRSQIVSTVYECSNSPVDYLMRARTIFVPSTDGYAFSIARLLDEAESRQADLFDGELPVPLRVGPGRAAERLGASS